ncbi:MAG: hypothetical protein CMP07_00075 [Xanthomonadales bacterium]|nr:hypothetical protein [Xanthomonadales bacterium]
MKATTWLALCATTILTLTAVNGRAGILSADLSIDKTVVSPTATPGAQITYSIVAENAGPNDAAGTTTVADTFAASLSGCAWTCTASAGSSCTAAGVGNISDTVSLLVNGTATYTATCDIDPAATGNLDNTATITADASLTDPNLADNESTVSSTLVPSADLSVTKTDNQASHTPGTPVSYTIVAANAGPSDVSDALVGDTFGAPLSNCSWTSVASGGATGNTNAGGNLADTLAMPAGSSVTYTATCDVDPAATGDLSNTATISSTLVTDPAAGNDSATDVSTLNASADLSISKTDGKTQHLAGTPISYTIVAQNSGPSAVSDALVSDVFPAPLTGCSWTSSATGGATGNTDGSGTLSDTLTMPVGSTVTYTAICGIPLDATGTLSNTATISSASATDPVPGDESATDGDTVLGAPVAVPTLSIWSLLALFAALALFGGAALSRRLA